MACVIPLLFCCATLLLRGSVGLAADPIVYPPGSGVFDVVRDGAVDNTGKTDVTTALQRIFDENPRRLRVIYFPRGTYLVSGQLRMKLDRSRKDTSHSHGPWLIGESRTATILRLKDATWTRARYGATPDAKGALEKRIDEQCVLSCGDSTNTTFNKIIRNLTINTGCDNAGAIGVMYNTSNSGCLSDVDIVSEDRKGRIGLALAGVENGPGQIRAIRISGFGLGIYGVSDYVIACSDITIDGATEAGILNRGIIAGEDIAVCMRGQGPALHNLKGGVLSLLGGKLRGEGGDVAVINRGDLFLRDLETSGFASAIAGASGTALSEYRTGEAVGLFHEPKGSMRLPIRKQPAVPYEPDFSRWTNPMDHGAKGDGQADDTEAVQQALSTPGKTHVMFPFGKVFRVRRPLVVGSDVVRVVGTQGRIKAEMKEEATFNIGDGRSPVFILETMVVPPIRIRTDRTVIIESSSGGYSIPLGLSKIERGKYKTTAMRLEGVGDVFMSNVADSFVIDNPRQRVWIRHYNSELGESVPGPEGRSPMVPVDVRAGMLWILGWKSENLTQRIRINEQGRMELTCFNNYSVSRNKKDGDWPIAEVIDGQFCLNQLVQRGREPNANIVWETRCGRTRKLTIEENPGGRNLPLYTGFDPEMRR